MTAPACLRRTQTKFRRLGQHEKITSPHGGVDLGAIDLRGGNGARGCVAARCFRGNNSGTDGAVVDQSAVGVSESTTATVTQAVASHGSGVNTGEVKVVTSTLFGGDELMLVAPRSASQMMSFVVTTKAGKVLVFDGGTEHDTEHLKDHAPALGPRGRADQDFTGYEQRHHD